MAGSALHEGSRRRDGKEADMTERTSYLEGTPSWVDLMTSDPGGARAFYGGLFGWEFDINPDPTTGHYTTCRLRGKRVAGMGGEPAPAGMPTVWITYFAVDDADKTAERIAEHGGKVQMAPMDVLDMGRWAMAADPSGASFGLWQARRHIGAELVNEPGTLTWNELNTRDLDAATAFYGDVFGLRWEDYGSAGDGPPYKVAYTSAGSVAGATVIGPDTPTQVPAYWGVYFWVEDAEASAAKATELGGTLLAPVFDSPQGPIAAVRDPHGATFAVIASGQAQGG
jgi:predicted enzyme related to lactoylglutathione lyase